MPLDAVFLAASLVALVAGLVRGFSGFGGALIFVPLIAALYDPARAGPTLLLVDFVLTAPLTIRAMQSFAPREVAPMAATAALFTPAGVFALSVADPATLRWAICASVGLILVALASGVRYAARPPVAATLGVGAFSGLLGGAAQLSGAPVAAYWLAGPSPRVVARANLIMFFALVSVVSAASFWTAGLFTAEVGWLALTLGPLYGLGVWAGARGFVGASDAAYRRAAFAIIAAAAILAAPLWDGLWR